MVFVHFARRKACHFHGRCNKPFKYDNNCWFCTVCDDVEFDDQCLEKLKAGKLAHRVCNPDHEWLRAPCWVDELPLVRKGLVNVGGELKDGKRIRGYAVPIYDWLDMLRDKWFVDKSGPFSRLPVESEGEEPARHE